MKVAMSESSEVCQFPSTEAIFPHGYNNVSASNREQRLLRGLGTFAFTNFVKIFTLDDGLIVKITCSISSWFSLPRIFEVIADFVLPLTMTSNVPQCTTICTRLVAQGDSV